MTVSSTPFALHPDRLFPPDRETRAIARELYASVAGAADRQPARPHRPAMVRRRRAVPRPGEAVHRSRPLRASHALQSGRAPRGPWRAAERRRAGRDRSAQDLAPVRRELSPVPRHAVLALAQPRLHRSLRLPRAPRRRQRRQVLRSHRRLPGAPGIPAARALRAVQHRGLDDDGEPARRPSPSPHDQVERLARPGAHRLPSRPGRRPRLPSLPREPRRARTHRRLRRLDLRRLSRRARQAARLFQVDRLHLDRPRPSDARAPRTCKRAKRPRSTAASAAAAPRPPTPNFSAPRC